MEFFFGKKKTTSVCRFKVYQSIINAFDYGNQAISSWHNLRSVTSHRADNEIHLSGDILRWIQSLKQRNTNKRAVTHTSH